VCDINRLFEYLLKEGYRNDPMCSCIYMKRSKNEFAIIIIYVNDINIVGTTNGLTKAIDCLKKNLRWSIFKKKNFCLRLQIWVFKQRCFYTLRDLYNQGA